MYRSKTNTEEGTNIKRIAELPHGSEQFGACVLSRFSPAGLFDPMDCGQPLDCSQPLRPWDSLGKNTGVGCHALLQGTFPTQGSNQRLLCLLQADSLPLSHWGSSIFRYPTKISFCFTTISPLFLKLSSPGSLCPFRSKRFPGQKESRYSQWKKIFSWKTAYDGNAAWISQRTAPKEAAIFRAASQLAHALLLAVRRKWLFCPLGTLTSQSGGVEVCATKDFCQEWEEGREVLHCPGFSSLGLGVVIVARKLGGARVNTVPRFAGRGWNALGGVFLV